MRRVSVVVIACAVFSIAPAAQAITAPTEASDAARFVELVNEARASEGLSPLVSSPGLAAHATEHTEQMIAAEEIFHTGRAELAAVAHGWELIGEDVGAAPDASALVSALLQTSEHSANVLGDYDTIGVGTVRRSDGTLWTTAIYLRSGAGTVIAGLENGFAWTRFASFTASREFGQLPSDRSGCEDGLACID
jgi:uncharacterized protein YkwD